MWGVMGNEPAVAGQFALNIPIQFLPSLEKTDDKYYGIITSFCHLQLIHLVTDDS